MKELIDIYTLEVVQAYMQHIQVRYALFPTSYVLSLLPVMLSITATYVYSSLH